MPENPNSKAQIEELQYELSIVLEAMLLFAGVKQQKLEKAIEIYIDKIDEVLENSQNEGVDEILEMIDFMKKNYKDLFA